MARKQIAGRESLQGLENAPQLRPFELSNVKSTGKNLGGGSYGTVEELEINGLICAGKKLFDALIEPGNQGVQQTVENYYRECSLLSDLRHPNVVQFLGICFLPKTRLPVLVMERLDGSLDELLESTPNIPLHVKVSILQDVTRGLVYLHNHKPPIIHRDLTARNVLLTPAMTAKVADLGNSRLLAKKMTRGVPGTLVYMPPEASDESNEYGTSLDMFSFGHLSLFTAIQEFPGDLLPSNYRDPKAKELKGRTPLERREVYINKLHRILNPKHALVVLIKGCLEYDADKRPVARQALDKLATVKASIPPTPYSELNKLQLEIALKQKEIGLKAEQDKFSAEREKKVVEERLHQETRSFVEQCRRLKKANLSLKEEVQQLMKEKEELKEKLEATEVQVQIFEEDFKAEREDRERAHSQRNEQEEKFKKEVMRLQSELEHTRQQLSSHKGNLSGKERNTEWTHTMDELKKAQEEIRAKTSQVKQYKKQLDAVTAKTSSLEKEREEIRTQFELLRKAAEKQSAKALIKTETKALPKKASSSQLHSDLPEQPLAAEGGKVQIGDLIVKNAELQQQVSILRAKLEKTIKKLRKGEEKKGKKAFTSEISISSPVSDTDVFTELSQVKELCLQLQDENDDLQAEVQTLSDVNKTLKQYYREFSGGGVPAASIQSTKQQSGQDTFSSGHPHYQHASEEYKQQRKSPPADQQMTDYVNQSRILALAESVHRHYQHGSEEYKQQKKSPPADQQMAGYVNQSRILAMVEEMNIKKHQTKLPESQQSAPLAESNSFDFPPPMVDFSSDQPMSLPQATVGQQQGNAERNQVRYGEDEHVGGGGASRWGGGVGEMGGGAHIQEELRRKQQQHGYDYQAHENYHDGLVSLPSVSASQVAALQQQNSAKDVGQPHPVPNSKQPASSRDNSLSASLNLQVQKTVEYVLEDGENKAEVTGLQAPLDPNLACPTCQRVFRLGQIQLFARHVSTCGSVV